MIRAFTILVDEKAMEIDKELNYTFKPMEEHLHQAIQKYYKEALLRRSQRIETAIVRNSQKDQSNTNVKKDGRRLLNRLGQNDSMLIELAENGKHHIRIDEIIPGGIQQKGQESPDDEDSTAPNITSMALEREA